MSSWTDNTSHHIVWIELDSIDKFAELWKDEMYHRLSMEGLPLVDNYRVRILRPSVWNCARIMKFLLFSIVLSASLLVLLGLFVTMFSVKTRIWPPPRMHSWQFLVTWILVYIGMIGVPVVGVLDWETLGYVHWFRYLIGGSLILFAVPFTIWAVRTLGLHQSSGLKGTLVTRGPYRYTRNPQYLACILLYMGVILITSSFMALITGMLVILCFALAPFSEEPWLLQQFGKQYEAYCRDVPRFIGSRSFQPKKRIRKSSRLT